MTPILLAIALLAGTPQCPVAASITINDNGTPIIIDGACMTVTAYDGVTVFFAAERLGDGIFKDGFDGE